MWYPDTRQPVVKFEDFNKVLKKYKGELDDISARLTLAKFLRSNIGFTYQLITNNEIEEFQEIMLKALFLKDNGIIIGGRGVSKSYLISIFCLLYPIFYPNTKICLISANFRSSRRILEYCEKIINSPGAHLLKQCFPKQLRKAQDLYRFELTNGCEVFALPLSNGEGLRGTRANVVCVDEGLLISEEIQTSIIRPFLTAKQDMTERRKIRAVEDELIAAGKLNESDRISFPRNKYFVFSSASFQFQYLYTLFLQTIDNIEKHSGKKTDPNYFAMRMSYEIVPEDSFIDMTQIYAAKANGGENTEYFKREYKAIFSDSGDGYFNVKKLHECTFAPGDLPTVQIVGDAGAEYILSIDPSYSASKSSDYFAMGVYLIDKKSQKLTLVHTYGRAGGDLKDHFEYLSYLLSYFNIVFFSIDASGTEFISGFNESTSAASRALNLTFLDCDFDKSDSVDYLAEISKAKRQYNLSSRRICYAQKFSSDSIRRMNEHLQNQIESKKVWFGSPIECHESLSLKYLGLNLPFSFKNKNDKELGMMEFIEEQDAWVTETKAQVGLIEVKSTSLGTLQYDMPNNVRRETGAKRPRKDNYTCLLMATYSYKIFNDIMFSEEKVVIPTFTPFII